MKKSYFRISVFFVIISFFCACAEKEDCHNTIYLSNKSSASIYYVSTLKSKFFNYDPSNPTYASDYTVVPNESKKIKIGITLSCWEQVIESADGYVYIYIYDKDELDIKGWAAVKNNPKKTYSLTIKRLNNSDWTIDYSN